jgi:hypothetical protein
MIFKIEKEESKNPVLAGGIHFFIRVSKRFPWEAVIWFAGLAFLALQPIDVQTHFTLCPLALSGIEWCPGCGLGHAITLLFHGEFVSSFNVHPLAFFAVIVLSLRIINLTKKYLTKHGESY